MAFTLTKADVTALAPELIALDDVRWQLPLAVASARCGGVDPGVQIPGLAGSIAFGNVAPGAPAGSAFGSDANAKLAATYLAAHLATLELQIQQNPKLAGAGPVTDVKVGPVSRGYASLADLLDDRTKGIDPSLALTRYGVAFRGLQRTFSTSRFVVT